MSARIGTTRIATAGWAHRQWRGAFYPPTIEPGDWLARYATELDAVEIESSLHELPSVEDIRHWRDAVPESFRFAARAPRALTHLRKLKRCENDVQTLVTRLAAFGERLGPILVQLPPRWRVNVARLGSFLQAVPEGVRVALEPRDESWRCAEVLEILRRHAAAFCISDQDVARPPLEVTADFVYVRLHGPHGGSTGNYRAERLRSWAGRALGWNREGIDVFVVFIDPDQAYSVRNARRLSSFLAEGAVHPGVPIAAPAG